MHEVEYPVITRDLDRSFTFHPACLSFSSSVVLDASFLMTFFLGLWVLCTDLRTCMQFPLHLYHVHTGYTNLDAMFCRFTPLILSISSCSVHWVICWTEVRFDLVE